MELVNVKYIHKKEKAITPEKPTAKPESKAEAPAKEKGIGRGHYDKSKTHRKLPPLQALAPRVVVKGTEISREDILKALAQAAKKAEYEWTIAEETTKWLPPFLAIMWLTGGRVSEVLALRGRDIKEYQMENGERVVIVSLINLKQRGGRNRVKESMIIPANYPKVWAYFEPWWREHPVGRLFERSRKTAWYHCHRIFSMGTHKVGRHSWVMERARRGADILDVKQMGGWSRLNSMDAYIHKFGRVELAKRMLAEKEELKEHEQEHEQRKS